MILIWLRGLLRSFSGRLIGGIAGIALTVALLAALGGFVADSSSSMTRHAIAAVSVDWQVQLNPTADRAAVLAAVRNATPYTALKRVWYADVRGFQSSSKGTVQTTGVGKVVGLGPGYMAAFPNEIRPFIGAHDGALLYQQTAANLHANVGDTIAIRRHGLPDASVRVDGIVAMPEIDPFFQLVGLPPGAAPQAPPDNVLLVPEKSWHRLFDRQAIARPDSVREQFHVRIGHRLPSDPIAAFTAVNGEAKKAEAQIAGNAVIGDNLAAKLLGTQADALYARVVFLFLGIPGAVLAGLLTFAVAASGSARRRRDQGLLRVRGASIGQVTAIGASEAIVVAFGGVALGLLVSIPIGVRWSHDATGWILVAASVGLAIAVVSMLMPAWIEARSTTVARARAAIGRYSYPLWAKFYVDAIVLLLGGAAYWLTASTGYQVVLAPEGIPQTSVHYQAFLAPFLLWIGASLLMVRVVRAMMIRKSAPLAWVSRVLAGGLAPIVTASVSRQHGVVTRAMLLVALAFAFGVSTAVFDDTYSAQSRVDAQLTNGADVSVTGTTAAPPSSLLGRLGAIPGVVAAAPMQHRFAFVGNDLQDLYGISPSTIGNVTPMSNAFFGNGNAASTLAALAEHPDGVLVSEETVQTYQLRVGDPLTLRLQDQRTHRYLPVRFRFVGVTREFPTAPKDSFLVANASYIARVTGSPSAEIVLLRVPKGIDAVSAQARRIAGTLPGAKVTNVLQSQRRIGSGLTSIGLQGLTAIELFFAVIFVAASTGLMLALSFTERIRTFGVLYAVGARTRQLGAFIWSETAIVLAVGGTCGIALGFLVAEVLVKILTGVFDPPPAELSIPWSYLALLVFCAIASSAAAVIVALSLTRQRVLAALRAL